jgi:hypothetical protein
MQKFLSAFLLLLVSTFATRAFAADYFVRQGASGTNRGTDWVNAWNELSQINFSTLSCGDTVWIAGGTYNSSLQGNKSCTAGHVLTFSRVRSTDTNAVAAAGWNPAFDSQVILPYIDIPGPSAYITIDGRIPNGMLVVISGTSGDGIDGGNGAGDGTNQPIDNITFSYIEVYGPPCVTSGNCTNGGVMGVNIMPYCTGANRTHLLFDHMSIHRTGEAFRGCGWDNSIVQYSLIYDTNNDGQQHEDILYSNPPYQNVTWRYNKIYASPNDGIFFEYGPGAVNFAFYGNVVYHSGGWLICFKTGSGDTYGPVYIYNNVFENDTTFGDYQPGFLGFSRMASGSEVANNVFENVTNTSEDAPPNANHNAYTVSGSSDGGPGSFYYSPGSLGASTLFVNESPGNPNAADFHLTAKGATTLAAGKALSAPYNLDPDGNPRGAGGNWTIGAFQPSAGTAPAPPTNLNGVVH